MSQTQTFIAHMVTVVIAVTAAIILAIKGEIDGATAVSIIVAAAGISLGAVVSASGASTATSAQNAGVKTAVVTTTTTAAPPAALVAPVVAAPVSTPLVP